jgi:hypothetical protein
LFWSKGEVSEEHNPCYSPAGRSVYLVRWRLLRHIAYTLEGVQSPRWGELTVVAVSSTPFSSKNAGRAFNASGVVPVTRSRFVFIDNLDPTALFELNLKADGTQRGAIKRRPLTGLAGGALSDPEGIARIDTDGGIDLIVASSLSVRSVGPGGADAHHGLARIRYRPDGDLRGIAMEGFREWLLSSYPAFAAAARKIPDNDGLNIEGLAWDPARRALLFGVRSPVRAGRIPVLCVHLDTAAPWRTAALQAGPVLSIEKSDFAVPQGIRDIDYDSDRQEFLVVIGRSISGGKVPFQLCTWDGNASTVNVLDVTFQPESPTKPETKPEGITAFPRTGARRILIVDDSGGFAVLPSL